MLLLSLVLFTCCRDTQSGREQPIRGEGAPTGNSTVGTSGTKVTGSTAMVTARRDKPNPVVPCLHQHRQQLNEQLQQSRSHIQPPPRSLQQQRRAGLLQPPHLPRLHSQAFSHGPLLTPLTALRGGLLGPTPVWPGGLSPAGAAALVWGFQQAGRDLTGSGLLAGYHNPAGQGSNRYRGGQRGGGFNGM